MPPTRITRSKSYHVDDGAKRGPMTMSQVRFHPTERVMVAACADRRIAVWQLDAAEVTVKNVAAVPGRFACAHDAGWVRCLDIAPDGTSLVTGGSDRRLRLWGWSRGLPAEQPAHDLEAHAGWVEAVAFAPDGSRLVTGGADANVKVWSADLSMLKTLSGHTGFIRDVAWTPDSTMFVSGAEDGQILVWDARTLELKRSISFGNTNEQYGQNPSLSGVHRLHISRDGQWVAAAGGKTVTIFNLASGAAIAEEKADAQVAFSPTADLLALGSNNARVLAYDAAKFQPAKTDKNGKPTTPAAVPGKELANIKVGDFSLGMRFSADGRWLGLGRADGKVEVWEVA